MERKSIKALNAILAFIMLFGFSYIYYPSYSETTVINSGEANITESGDYEIENGVTNVVISGNITVNIILKNVTINTLSPNNLGKPPILVTGGATANIVLVGENTLTAGYTTSTFKYWKTTTQTKTVTYGYAGLQVDKDASVVIRR